MDVTIQTSHTCEVDPEEIATVIIEKGFYVHSVSVVSRPGGFGDARVWTDGN